MAICSCEFIQQCEPPERGYRFSVPFTTTTYVEVTVGKASAPRRTWILIEQYLATVSPWFEAALKKEWMARKSKRCLELDDVDPGVFSIFVEWLHGRKLLDKDGIPLDLEKSPYIRGLFDGPAQEAWTMKMRVTVDQLVCIYQFADEYDIPQLRRDTTDRLSRLSQVCFPYFIPWPGSVSKAFANLPANSPMLQLLADILAQNWSESDLSEESLEESGYIQAPKMLLFKVLENRVINRMTPVKRLLPCDYHEHKDK
ncbi:hypothetical protein FKW77_002560 [Venturia effusa]|uniref:BTB domain-containing protein n=1 Tax=Venturia effusa TaxID=50376 RepID=A0A517KVZ4_9PEZI|nr:hypothetical protein FKW77_002560 [Venturia effusa]